MLGWSKENGGNKQDDSAQAADVWTLKDINVPPNTCTEIPMDDVKYDSGNFSNLDGKVHINEDGVYIIAATLAYDPKITGSYRLEIYNGSTAFMAVTTMAPVAPTDFRICVTQTHIGALKKGDILSLCGRHTAKTAVNVLAGSGLSIAKLK